MTLDKNDLNKIDGIFSRYVKVMDEHFQSQVKPIIEMQQEQGKKIDALFIKVAQNTEDIAVIKILVKQNTKDIGIMKKDIVEMKKDINVTKKDITIMKSDISFIKQDLKQKVDRDEFNSLKKE